MIKISAPIIEDTENKSYLKAKVEIPNEAVTKWKEFSESAKTYSYLNESFFLNKDYIEVYYEVDKMYRKYLCIDRNDAFIVSILHFAIVTGQDIESETPVSSKLLFNLNELLIPTFCNKYTGYRKIKIIAKSINTKLENDGRVGTGMSCGIDSMHTVASLTKDSIDNEYKIDVLTFLDTGASHYLPHLDKKATLEIVNKEADLVHKRKILKARETAKELNMDLLEIRSNMSDIYQGMFGASHVYRNLSAILCLQSFFSKYYYSSGGYELDTYNLSLKTEQGKYEMLAIQVLSTENIDFMCGGKAKTRIMKTQEIADIEFVQNHLNVCNLDENCCNCSKCYRTLITLDMIGKLDKFSKVFDMEKYKKNKWKSYYWLLKNSKKEKFAKLIYEEGRECGYFSNKIIIKTYLNMFWKKIRGKK